MNMENEIENLSKIHLFSILKAKKVFEIINNSKLITINPNSLIIKANEKNDFIYILEKGPVFISKQVKRKLKSGKNIKIDYKIIKVFSYKILGSISPNKFPFDIINGKGYSLVRKIDINFLQKKIAPSVILQFQKDLKQKINFYKSILKSSNKIHFNIKKNKCFQKKKNTSKPKFLIKSKTFYFMGKKSSFIKNKNIFNLKKKENKKELIQKTKKNCNFLILAKKNYKIKNYNYKMLRNNSIKFVRRSIDVFKKKLKDKDFIAYIKNKRFSTVCFNKRN